MAFTPGHCRTPSLALADPIVLLRVIMHHTYVRHLALPCKPQENIYTFLNLLDMY
jgi:hypothetical protein